MKVKLIQHIFIVMKKLNLENLQKQRADRI